MRAKEFLNEEVAPKKAKPAVTVAKPTPASPAAKAAAKTAKASPEPKQDDSTQDVPSKVKLSSARKLDVATLRKFANGGPNKDKPRLDILYAKVQSGPPFYKLNGEQFVADNSPGELRKLASRINYIKANPKEGRLKIELKDKFSNDVITTDILAKTTEFGGQNDPIGGDGVNPEDIKKSAIQVKPSQVLPQQPFSPSQLGSAILNSSALEAVHPTGAKVKSIAKQIMDKVVMPTFEAVSKDEATAIRDNAGEYLGVLAMIENIVEFPNREVFYHHLGIQNINQCLLEFPRAQNNPLGDSELLGDFVNPKTGTKIFISSKGAKGAPPSLNGLKIPEELEKVRKFKKEIEFIKIAQDKNISGIEQPFYLLNYLIKTGAVNEKPFIDLVTAFMGNPALITEMLNLLGNMDTPAAQYKTIIPLFGRKFNFIKTFLDQIGVNTVSPKASIAGAVHYFASKEVVRQVNVQNALPNFEQLAREILQKNFIQIHTYLDPKLPRPGRHYMKFSVLWPDATAGKGRITLETKSSATEPGKGKMSFLVSPN